MLNDKAKDAGITILGEMGLDPGIGKSYLIISDRFPGLQQNKIVYNSASGLMYLL